MQRQQQCDFGRTQVEQECHTFTASRLNDEDIFPSNALLDFHSSLAAFELGKKDFCGRNAEVVADGPASTVSLRHSSLCRGATYSVSCGWEEPPKTTRFLTGGGLALVAKTGQD